MNKKEGEEEEEDIPIFRSSRSIVQPTRYSRASLKSPLNEPPDGYQVKEALPSPSPLIKSEPLEKKNSLAPPIPIIKSEPRASSANSAKLSEQEGSKARSVMLHEQLSQSQTDFRFGKSSEEINKMKFISIFLLSFSLI